MWGCNSACGFPLEHSPPMQLAGKGIHCNIFMCCCMHTCVDKGWTQGGILVPKNHLLLPTEGWTGTLGRLFLELPPQRQRWLATESPLLPETPSLLPQSLMALALARRQVSLSSGDSLARARLCINIQLT